MANIDNGWSEIDWIVDAAQNPVSNNFVRFAEAVRWNQDQKSLEDEHRKISSIRKTGGWTAEGRMKRIGSMPLHIFNLMKRIDREFAANTPRGKALYLKFIKRYPLFSAD